MDIDLFVKAYIGGLLIGLAAIWLMLFNGRIAGISGIAASLLKTVPTNASWQWLFVAGLAMSSVLWQFSGLSLEMDIVASPALLILGGLLVGFGTRLGSGCTSGHGVCGIARFSMRSVVATCIFISSGAMTVVLLRLMGGVV